VKVEVAVYILEAVMPEKDEVAFLDCSQPGHAEVDDVRKVPKINMVKR